MIDKYEYNWTTNAVHIFKISAEVEVINFELKLFTYTNILLHNYALYISDNCNHSYIIT